MSVGLFRAIGVKTNMGDFNSESDVCLGLVASS